MAKRLKNMEKASMFVKRSFEHLLKRKEKYIKVKLTMLTCSSFTLKRAVSLVSSSSNLFLDEV
jgi:hypothetical protein